MRIMTAFHPSRWCVSGRLALVAAALLLHFSAAGATAGPIEPGGPPTVVVAPAGQADVAPTAEYVGHVEAVQTVELLARVEGYLERVDFREGAEVRENDLLFLIEQAPYRARLAMAQARLDSTRAELDRAEKLRQRLESAGPQSVSATDLDNAEAAVAAGRANAAEAEAGLELARLDLSYTEIRAPIAGRLGRTAYTRGNLVGPGSGMLARLIQQDPVRVVYAVSENDLAPLLAALAAKDGSSPLLAPRLRLPDGSDYALPGRVAFVDNRVDPATGTIAVRAEFPNTGGLLVPGRYVTVQVRTAPPRLLPVVPQSAVIVDKEGSRVLMVDSEGTVVSRPITLGPAKGAAVAVTSGLAPGETVIVSGIQKARPGSAVRTVPAAEVKEGGAP